MVRERRGARLAGTIAGAVYDPNRDELFTATRDGPGDAERAEARSSWGSPVAGEARAGGSPGARGGDLATAMVATGLAYDAEVRAAQARVLARLVPRVRDIRRFGSAALDLTWTAAGRYDAYFERTVKQWDIAAGALICERAGLRVLELPGPRGPAVGDPRGSAGAGGAAARAGRGWRGGVPGVNVKPCGYVRLCRRPRADVRCREDRW